MARLRRGDDQGGLNVKQYIIYEWWITKYRTKLNYCRCCCKHKRCVEWCGRLGYERELVDKLGGIFDIRCGRTERGVSFWGCLHGLRVRANLGLQNKLCYQVNKQFQFKYRLMLSDYWLMITGRSIAIRRVLRAWPTVLRVLLKNLAWWTVFVIPST